MPLSYPIRLTTDEGGVRVSCRDLPELLTWGDDEAEALAMAPDAIAVLLSDAREAGFPVPAPSEALDGELLVEV